MDADCPNWGEAEIPVPFPVIHETSHGMLRHAYLYSESDLERNLADARAAESIEAHSELVEWDAMIRISHDCDANRFHLKEHIMRVYITLNWLEQAYDIVKKSAKLMCMQLNPVYDSEIRSSLQFLRHRLEGAGPIIDGAETVTYRSDDDIWVGRPQTHHD